MNHTSFDIKHSNGSESAVRCTLSDCSQARVRHSCSRCAQACLRVRLGISKQVALNIQSPSCLFLCRGARRNAVLRSCERRIVQSKINSLTDTHCILFALNTSSQSANNRRNFLRETACGDFLVVEPLQDGLRKQSVLLLVLFQRNL